MPSKLHSHLLVIAIAIFVVPGCTDAERASLSAYGEQHVIELYSGGQKVREWQSTGKVFSEENSDGFYFKDSATGKLVRVTGDVVVTPYSKDEKKADTANSEWKPVPPDVDAGKLISGEEDPFEEAAKKQ